MKKKKEMRKESPKELKKVVANAFCGPLERKPKEKCVDFYEKWAEDKETKFQKAK